MLLDEATSSDEALPRLNVLLLELARLHQLIDSFEASGEPIPAEVEAALEAIGQQVADMTATIRTSN